MFKMRWKMGLSKQEKKLIKLIELASKLVLLEDRKLFEELGKKWMNY